MPQNDVLRMLLDNEERLKQTETRETPGNIPGFTSFYDTGSFTPAWVGSTIAGTFTYTANATLVEWTRIGNRLFFAGRIVITAIGVAPTGVLQVSGWPFAAVADTNMLIAGGGVMITWAINTAAGYTDVSLQFTNGAVVGSLTRSGDNVVIASVLGGELIVGDCRFEGQYRVA